MRLAGRVTFAASAHDALEGADALVVVTEWNEFRFPDFVRIREALKEPVVFDGRNVYDRDALGDRDRTFVQQSADPARVPFRHRTGLLQSALSIAARPAFPDSRRRRAARLRPVEPEEDGLGISLVPNRATAP